MANNKGITLTATILMYLASIIILLILLSTAFGKGVVFNIMTDFSQIEPKRLANNIAVSTMIASYSPDDFSFKVGVKAFYNITIEDISGVVNVKIKPSSTSAFEAFGNQTIYYNPECTFEPALPIILQTDTKIFNTVYVDVTKDPCVIHMTLISEMI